MGLFDFASDIGNKIFGNGDEAAEKITEQLQDVDLNINNINATFNAGIVTLSGETDDPVAIQKAILIAGNMQGVSEVINNTSQQLEEESLDVEYYLIQSGDSLSKIAKKYYGDASAYPKIFEANKEVIVTTQCILYI